MVCVICLNCLQLCILINSYKSLGKYDNFIHLYTKQLVLGLTAFSILKISDWSDEMSDIFKDMQGKRSIVSIH